MMPRWLRCMDKPRHHLYITIIWLNRFNSHKCQKNQFSFLKNDIQFLHIIMAHQNHIADLHFDLSRIKYKFKISHFIPTIFCRQKVIQLIHIISSRQMYCRCMVWSILSGVHVTDAALAPMHGETRTSLLHLNHLTRQDDY